MLKVVDFHRLLNNGGQSGDRTVIHDHTITTPRVLFPNVVDLIIKAAITNIQSPNKPIHRAIFIKSGRR